MNITVFGSTGKTGQAVLQKALEQGHRVTAYARSPHKITIQHANLTLIKGDLHEVGAIDRALQGADAVISILGPAGPSPGLPISKGIAHIIASMEKQGVKRLIATATPSAADPADQFDFKFRLAVFLIKLFTRSAYDDIVETAKLIKKSSLDWSLIRLPFLTDTPQRGPIVTGYLGEGKVKLFWLNRNDLADFLLEQLTDRRFITKGPAISNA